MGWSSPVVSVNETSPEYGTKITSVDTPQSNNEVKSPEADLDTRHMPGMSVAVPKPTAVEPTTSVEPFNACNIVE